MTNLSQLAEPPVHQMDGAAFDYFLIELVNTLRESSSHALKRQKQTEAEMIRAGVLPAGTSQEDENKDEEEVRARLEKIGAHVGANYTERLCRDRGLFNETLDAVKFICKDVWVACWDKQVDNLRTNHRGVYVLQDNAFKPITRLSSWESRADALKRAKIYVALPGGIIKGALSRLGFNGSVSPELTSLPQCTFQVKLPK